MVRRNCWRQATKLSFLLVLFLALLVLARDLFGVSIGLLAPQRGSDVGIPEKFPTSLLEDPRGSESLLEDPRGSNVSSSEKSPTSALEDPLDSRSTPSLAQKSSVPTTFPLPSQQEEVFDQVQFPDRAVKVPELKSCKGTPWRLGPIEVHVIAWQRPKSTEVLLRQLEVADYAGWDEPVPCHIHMDGGADDASKAVVEDFKWSHGPKLLDIRTKNVGLRDMWLSSLDAAARGAGPFGLVLLFEDDIRVSPLYFLWLLRVLDEYGRNPECRDANLIGISLSPIRMMEMAKPWHKWAPSRELPDGKRRHSVFLANLASSWAPAYFTDRWMEFTEFHKERIQFPFYDAEAEKVKVSRIDDLVLSPHVLQIPNSRSNFWAKSWKRFLIDLMYGRGTLMLYSNLPGERALATTMQFAGAHVRKDKKTSGDSSAASPSEADFKRNWRIAPVLEEFHSGFRWDADGMRQSLLWPLYESLSVRDLWLKPSSREILAAAGTSFLDKMSHTGSQYSKLVRVWARPGWQLPRVCAADLVKPSSHANISSCARDHDAHL